MDKIFELADSKQKILKGHLCSECDFILLDAHSCKNRCEQFCKNHFPQNRKCQGCGEEFLPNQEINRIINEKYKMRCIECKEKLKPSEMEQHKPAFCKIECHQKCGKRFYSTEIEKHIKIDCPFTIINCIGCKQTDTRGTIMIHQELCENAILFQKNISILNQNHLKEIQSLKDAHYKEIENQRNQFSDQINSLKNEISSLKISFESKLDLLNQTIIDCFSSREKKEEGIKIKKENQVEEINCSIMGRNHISCGIGWGKKKICKIIKNLIFFQKKKVDCCSALWQRRK